MRSLGTTTALLISGILALLLVAYVFVGDGFRHSHNAPHCTSREGLDEVKRELFRRAAALRGTDHAAFAGVAQHSVARTTSRMVRRHYRASEKVTCTGSLTLDLPPGVAVAGGRHSLASELRYDLAPASSGTARLLMLSRADAIVVPLATLGQVGPTSQPVAAAADPDQAETAALGADQPPPRSSAPSQAEPTKNRLPVVRKASGETPRKPPPPAPVPTAAPPPAPARDPAAVASARPSFNCRYARTRGEIAVCRNSALASLDRQMAVQFFSAIAVARPGQRAMLQRTRVRFLSYRDSCTSEACIADAYRARMREISQIMSGQW